MELTFTIERVDDMPTAHIRGKLPSPPAGIVTSHVTVTETGADGTPKTPATYDVPAGSDLLFTAAVGSTLTGNWLYEDAAGRKSKPTAFTPFAVTDPSPAAPVGDIAFSVESVEG